MCERNEIELENNDFIYILYIKKGSKSYDIMIIIYTLYYVYESLYSWFVVGFV